MIYGIGTDIVAVDRLQGLLDRHGSRAVEKLLAPSEIAAFEQSTAPGRFLAKRFAAKEAFGKALGTGVAAPATLTQIAVGHDPLGKPVLEFAPPLAALLESKKLSAQLSISDEQAYAVAFVILEQK